MPIQRLLEEVRAVMRKLHYSIHTGSQHICLQGGTDIRTIQALLGHKDLKTTMIHTHVLNQGAQGVPSPLDDL